MYQHTVNARSIPPQSLDLPGVTIRLLWSDPHTGALTVLTEMQPGALIPKHRHTQADETVYVLEGDFIEDAPWPGHVLRRREKHTAWSARHANRLQTTYPLFGEPGFRVGGLSRRRREPTKTTG